MRIWVDKLLDRFLPISPAVRLLAQCLEQDRVRVTIATWAGCNTVTVEPVAGDDTGMVSGTDTGHLRLMLSESGLYLWNCTNARNERVRFNVRENLWLCRALDRWINRGCQFVSAKVEVSQ